jgi:hypothetical protein
MARLLYRVAGVRRRCDPSDGVHTLYEGGLRQHVPTVRPVPNSDRRKLQPRNGSRSDGNRIASNECPGPDGARVNRVLPCGTNRVEIGKRIGVELVRVGAEEMGDESCTAPDSELEWRWIILARHLSRRYVVHQTKSGWRDHRYGPIWRDRRHAAGAWSTLRPHKPRPILAPGRDRPIANIKSRFESKRHRHNL